MFTCGLSSNRNLRQNDGEGDSDSDDDQTSESCSNGVCTTVTKMRGKPGSATQTGLVLFPPSASRY